MDITSIFSSSASTSDQQLITQVSTVMKDGGSRYFTDRYPDSIAYFSNIANVSGIRDAVNMYGIPSHGATFQTFIKFYYAAKYFNTFPLPVADPANCTAIGAMRDGLNKAIANADIQFQSDNDVQVHNIKQAILTDRINQVEGMYDSMSCDAVINNQQVTQNAELISQAANPGTTSSAGTYIVIGIAIIIVVVAAKIIFHKHKTA